ncbi:hypothetical protein [uncultured Campylobacter sp.]|uniref:hypothetical protein n=1 Tax=uncultured Campylobacter sp. TaxID=218934 RepID=UPI00261D6783|nr:hypothetical protein [uncultured Campylobacter sp.]
MRVAHDGALLPIIKEAKKSQRERNFYVVHLMGNHMDYKKRYPEEFDNLKATISPYRLRKSKRSPSRAAITACCITTTW